MWHSFLVTVNNRWMFFLSSFFLENSLTHTKAHTLLYWLIGHYEHRKLSKFNITVCSIASQKFWNTEKKVWKCEYNVDALAVARLYGNMQLLPGKMFQSAHTLERVCIESGKCWRVFGSLNPSLYRFPYIVSEETTFLWVLKWVFKGL